MPRMNILNQTEQAMFDMPPVFNSAERKQFFNFSSSLLETALSLRKPANRIRFLLACGYFRAAKRFFRPQDYHQRDIEYVAWRIDLSPEQFFFRRVLPSCKTEASDAGFRFLWLPPF